MNPIQVSFSGYILHRLALCISILNHEFFSISTISLEIYFLSKVQKIISNIEALIRTNKGAISFPEQFFLSSNKNVPISDRK